MTYGLWLSTAGLQANDYRQAIMANNLANANTVGFKHDLAVIQERPPESSAEAGNRRFTHPILNDLTGGLWVRPTVPTFAQGDLDKTGGPLDVAVDGDGFFTVRDGDKDRFTRDGRMTLNSDGELVMTSAGGRVRILDEGGGGIQLDLNLPGVVSISSDGAVLQGTEVVGRIGLTDFDDRTQLSKIGENLYRNHGSAEIPATGRFRSGHVERSTSDPVRGMASMIDVSRAYQLNANLISLQDQTIGQAVSRVGRIG